MPIFVKTNQVFPQDIPSLTSLRFYMAAIVIFHHLFDTYAEQHGISTNPFEKGYLGVDFFFILSGFILTHVYHKTLLTKKISARNFYIRRLARIYPLHIFMLFISLTLNAFFGYQAQPGNSPATFFANIFMIQAWGFSPPSFNTPSWSISAEWFAYLFFPLLLFFIKKTALNVETLLASALIIFLVFCAISPLFFSAPLTTLSFNGGIARIVPEFFLGVSLYFFGQCYRWKWSNNLVLAFVAAMIVLASGYAGSDLFIILFFGIMISICAEQSVGGVKNFLSKRMSVWLGEISYALYIVHIPILGLMMGVTPFIHSTAPDFLIFFTFIIAPLLTLLFAVLSHYLVEIPCRRFIAKFQFKS